MSRPLAPLSSLLALRFWGMHLLAAFATTAALLLGLWQYDAWQTRRAEAAVDLTDVAPQPFIDLIGPDDPFPSNAVGRPAEVTGRWISDSTFFVSGRESDGEDGYWVVTGFDVDQTGSALLVVRGWSSTPEAGPVQGTADLTGWLQPTEASGEPDDDPQDNVVPQLRTADAAQRVTQDLYGAYMIVDPERSTPPGDDLVAASFDQLPPVGAFTSIRNLLYALEWWVFSGFAVYAWCRWVQDVRRGGSEEDDPEEPDPADEPEEELAARGPGGSDRSVH